MSASTDPPLSGAHNRVLLFCARMSMAGDCMRRIGALAP